MPAIAPGSNKPEGEHEVWQMAKGSRLLAWFGTNEVRFQYVASLLTVGSCTVWDTQATVLARNTQMHYAKIEQSHTSEEQKILQKNNLFTLLRSTTIL